MSALKRQVDGYVAGMTKAAEKSRAVDAGSEFVKRIPDARVQGLVDGVLFLVGGELAFADSDGKQFTLKVSADGVECFSGSAHAPESTEEVTR